MSVKIVHTCLSIAEGCKRSTMSTFKTNQNGKKSNCVACATNVAAGRPQHAEAIS